MNSANEWGTVAAGCGGDRTGKELAAGDTGSSEAGPGRVDRPGGFSEGVRSGLFLDPKLLQLRDDCLTSSLRLHLFVDREDLSVRSDVERPSIGELTLGRHHAVGGGDL